MKKKLFIAAVIGATALAGALEGCDTEANRVSYNLSQEADNFNDIRQITVINCLQGDVLFQMTGKMSITADAADNQLEVIVEDEKGEYKKHFIGLSDNVTYVGDVLFQMTGKMSITADAADNQLEVIVEDEKGEYKKHFIGLSDNVTYVVEDVTAGDVEKYKYTLNFNPEMWLPYEVETID